MDESGFGFAAVLAVLITGAFKADNTVFHPYSRSNIMKSSPNILERAITEFMEFIGAHQSVYIVLSFVMNTLEVLISCIAWFSSEIRPECD
ncbi:hypothetical protein Tco_1112933 [Tanacetum coccineum]|uniref:Uncharacterized protein n=1 Tax=Tanacetum coccineum TaxID=301880 RepID=A0ABQ5IQQ9_9ASTR